MKILVVSDNHGDDEILTKIANHFKEKVDLLLHCGDSELNPTQVPMTAFQAVKGNNDYRLNYPQDLVLTAGDDQILLTHGDHYQVNYSLTPLMLKGEEQAATIICYGHTHQLGVEYDHHMLILNPGSISLPRGQYVGLGGTFAIIDSQPTSFVVDYYNRALEPIADLHFEFNR